MARNLTSAKDLTGAQKAAVVLISLGPRDSASILKHIPETEADAIARAIARLDQVSTEQVQQVLEEFAQGVTSHRLFVKGGLEYANEILVEAYGPETAKRLIDRLAASLGGDNLNFEHFRKADPQQLAKLIQDEHPQTIALILSHLDASQAATLISSLPIETRAEVSIRMASLDQISPEVVRNIAFVLEQKLQSLGELSRENRGGVRAVANMFNRLDPHVNSELMEAVESRNPPLFENIRRFMFVFRDLESLDPAALKTLTAKIDRPVLITALKGADPSLRQKFLATQSSRGAEMIAEEIEALGPVRLKDVDSAQQTIITIARELEKEGLISLTNSPNEQYVY
ncbi:MAG: flagellar motor switch protein FliG [Acidobacteriaceae bacterium]|nr:flagellar motor switch protein FliG [Acidobacteriaceae bacterium]